MLRFNIQKAALPKPFLMISICLLMAINSKSQSLDWVKTWGNDYSEYSSSMIVSKSGNIYVSGYFMDSMDMDPGQAVHQLKSNGGYDMFIARFDHIGNFNWAINIGGGQDDFTSGNIALDAFGNVYVCGGLSETTDFKPGADSLVFKPFQYSSSAFIAKYDTSGAFQWVKMFEHPEGYIIGNRVMVDAENNIVGTGFFQGNIDFDPTLNVDTVNCGIFMSCYVVKLNAGGDRLWAKQFQSTYWATTSSMFLDENSNIYLTGTFYDSLDCDPGNGVYKLAAAGKTDIFGIKLSKNGELIWAKRLGGKGEDGIESVKTDQAGNIYFAGYFEDTADFDPGTGHSYLMAHMVDAFVTKLDQSGNFVWTKGVGGWGVDVGKDLEIGQNGHVYLTGYFNVVADFDPGPGVYYVTPSARDMFLLNLDQNGNFRWVRKFGGSATGSCQTQSMVLQKNGHLVMMGTFLNYIDVDPSPLIRNIASMGGNDLFLLSLNTQVADKKVLKEISGFSVLPNPSQGLVKIEGINSSEIQKLEIIDPTGKVCESHHYKVTLSNNSIELDLSNNQGGLYILNIKTKDKEYYKKLILTQ